MAFVRGDCPAFIEVRGALGVSSNRVHKKGRTKCSRVMELDSINIGWNLELDILCVLNMMKKARALARHAQNLCFFLQMLESISQRRKFAPKLLGVQR